jgi:hypothetical protein
MISVKVCGQMALEQLFSGHEILRVPHNIMPATWQTLLSIPLDQALTSICECLSLGVDAFARVMLFKATDIGVAVPKRRRDRKDVRLWTLAVLYTPSKAMLFSCPTLDFLRTTCALPPVLGGVAKDLGALRFDQFSGRLIWPALIEKLGQDIRSALDDHQTIDTPYPFYDHGTGDYDVWFSTEIEKTWQYNHENHTFKPYSVGGFPEWFDRKFRENVQF